MTTASGKKKQYDEMAPEYNAYEDIPIARLEAELITTALGDCTGYNILDLGGGSGVYAREAVRLGAKRVDVVDISDSMMKIGRDIESKSRGKSRIRWLLGDASKPMEDQEVDILPPGEYDITMANWIFDHAYTVNDLRGMWESIAKSLKPGGKFIGVRAIAPGCFAPHNVTTGKYGCLRSDIKMIPGGFQCKATLLTKKPFSVGCTLMEDSYNLVDAIPREFGLTDFEIVPDAESETVNKDRKFWQEHVDDPCFAVVTATKI
ncbi:S-adenosyl-L-methionine-dependent methyltransferase [Aaosphaeria arxii CBS 175.79]|uniref:S-adenosyl-L-methionine-dependent methyltransferase n=1 Tax=Aaosphaeria arxii CBS 175.79 TaxID=1450172 RepID=A0A6A5Y3W7_9PLEO|nr:S-adenosyl-L-methionine-dependent methyltransferase [Aaosphaeria arxii CBS 175.79]KAF2019956.1 S-adenosyl-L-methionine-dependent methyltransferase [Aaosphaeria arxii CBS 175.79]